RFQRTLPNQLFRCATDRAFYGDLASMEFLPNLSRSVESICNKSTICNCSTSDQSNNSDDNPLNSTEYKIYKFVTKDVLGNAVKELAEADADFSKFNKQQYLLKVVRGFN